MLKRIMASFLRIVLKLFFSLFIFGILVQGVLYFSLSIPEVRHFALKKVNEYLIPAFGLSVNFRSLQFNVFNTTLILSEGSLNVSDNAQNSEKLPPLANVESLSLRIVPLTSYFTQKLVLSSLQIKGLDLFLQSDNSGKIIIPSQLQILNTSSSEKLSLDSIFKSVKSKLPRHFRLSDGKLTIRSADKKWHTDAFIESFLVVTDPNIIESARLYSFALLGGAVSSNMIFLKSQFDLDLKRSSLQGSINALGQGSLSHLVLESNLGDANVSGSFELFKEINKLEYRLRSDIQAKLDTLGSALGFVGLGKVHASFLASRVRNQTSLLPSLSGNLDWNGLKVEGRDFLFGNIKFATKGTRFQVLSGSINNIDAVNLVSFKGWVEKSGEMPFQFVAETKNLPFDILMNALNIETKDVITFDLASPRILIDGKIYDDSAHGKEKIQITAEVDATHLKVPSVHDDSRASIPPCSVQLRILIQNSLVKFDDSFVNCARDINDFETRIKVKSGYVSSADADTYFDLESDNLNAAHFSYFLKKPLVGTGQLTGQIIAKGGLNVTWFSHMLLEDGVIFDIPFKILEGDWGIDDFKVSGSNVLAELENEVDNASVSSEKLEMRKIKNLLQLSYFEVLFKNAESSFVGDIEGNSKDVFFAFAQYLPKEHVSKVDIKQFRASFRQNGPVSSIENWTLKLNLEGKQLSLYKAQFGKIKLDLNCKMYRCSDSKVEVSSQRWSTKNPTLASTPKSASLELDIKDLSKESLSLVLLTRNFPVFDVVPNLQGKYDGELNGSLRIDFDATKLVASGKIVVPELKLNEMSMGPTYFDVSHIKDLGISVRIATFGDEILGRLIMKDFAETRPNLILNISNFSLERFSKSKINLENKVTNEAVKENVTGVVSAYVNLTFPTLKSLIQEQGDFLSNIEGKANLYQVNANFKEQEITLSKPTSLELKNGIVTLSESQLLSELTDLKSMGKFSLETMSGNLDLTGVIDLRLLNQWNSKITTAGGQLILNVSFIYDDSSLQIEGEINIKNGQGSYKDLSPPFQNLEAKIVLHDGVAEIRQFRANRGKGSVSLVGTVEWQDYYESETLKAIPLSLRLEMDAAQFRYKIPVFDASEIALSGVVQISGKDYPYQVAGQIKLDSGRLSKSANCQTIIKETPPSEQKIVSGQLAPWAEFNLLITAEESIRINGGCLNGYLSTNLRLVGDSNRYNLQGDLSVNAGRVYFLKSTFEIQKGSVYFENPMNIEPRIDMQLVSKIDNYRVYAQIEGVVGRNRVNLWSDPNVTPGGSLLSRADLLRMLATGQGPQAQSYQTGTSSALASSLAGYIYDATTLDESLSQSFSKLTGGFIDNVQLQPLIENGQTRWKAKVRRSLGERLNLGLDLDQGIGQTLTGTYLLNDTVNVLGGFERNTGLEGYSEFSGGFRFQFGR